MFIKNFKKFVEVSYKVKKMNHYYNENHYLYKICLKIACKDTFI